MMAKTWYPVIDYAACVECGTCSSFCPHGVYDTARTPTPVVTDPQACIDCCHSCGNRCPVGAITYVGDSTGWKPPNGTLEETKEACCSCGCEGAFEKKIVVEYLYLDLQTCDRCIGMDAVLDEAMATLTPALKLYGYEVVYYKIEIKTAELAEQFKLISSPTIRVNGQDICGIVKENSCGCCSEISGTDVNCRVFEYRGERYEVPPRELLAEAILKTIFAKTDDCACGNYQLPDNLKSFFQGKTCKSACSCNGSCC
ncbi:hypothetical protein OBV_07050 [Oscillibacter valericigenes Sjm18-20]|nr:hypothetical protein OBV_07050 [Oscillibacter valericigenes Sjm18-20]